MQDEIGHRTVGWLACVKEADLDRSEDQFAQQRRLECTTPAGAHTAQCGGAIHEPCSVHTLITPDTE